MKSTAAPAVSAESDEPATFRVTVAPSITVDSIAPQPVQQMVAAPVTAAESPLSSLLGSGPAGAVESPALWVLLAASRRQLGSESSTRKNLNTVAADAQTGEPLDTDVEPALTLAALAAPAAVAALGNQPPVIADPVLGEADTVTGAVTGQVSASDPESKKLSYALKSGPAQGSLSFDKKTGAFTYTPTTAQRVLAGVSDDEVTAEFTVTVSDGKNKVDTVISVPVDPTPVAVLGHANAGSDATGVAVSNNRAYVTNLSAGTVTVINTLDNTVVTTIPVGPGPTTAAITPDGSKVYVVTQGTNSVAVIDTGSNTVVKTIAVGEAPVGVAIAPNGKTVYVTNAIGGTVTKIATSTNKVIGTVKNVGTEPSLITVSPDSKTVYVTNSATDSVSWFAASSSTAKSITGLGDLPTGLAVSPDSTRLYVTALDGSVTVIDTKKKTVVEKFSVGGELAGAVINGDGTVLLVAALDGTVSAVDIAARAVLTSTATPASGSLSAPIQVAISPDGQQLYLTDPAGKTLQVVTLLAPDTAPTADVTSISDPSPATGAVKVTIELDDLDGDAISYNVPVPAHGTLTFDTANGFVVTYTPTAAARHAAAGSGPTSDTVTLTFDDGRRGFITVTVTVPIDAVNAVPTVKTSVGNPKSSTGVVTGSLKATDKDKDTLTYGGSTTTAKGTVVVDAKGKFTYTPTAEARHAAATGAPGTTTDTFTLTAYDGHGGAADVSVTVKIRALNSAPDDAKAVVTQTNTATGVVTGKITATDTDGDAFTYGAPATTKKGSVAVAADGTFTYAPTEAARQAASAPKASSSTKTDSFTVTISDGHGGTDQVTVKVTIVPISATQNHAPVAGTTTIGTPNATTGIVIGSVKATDADGDVVSYSLTTPLDPDVGIVAVDSATGAWAFRPTGQSRFDAYFTSATEAASFSITASDGKGATTPISVTAPVDPAVELSYDYVMPLDGTRPAGMTVAPDGHLYVSNFSEESGDIALTVLNSDGDIETTITLDGNGSWGVAVGSDGRVYATTNTAAAGQIWAIDPSDGYSTELFAEIPGFTTAIAIDEDGRVYVAGNDTQASTSTIHILSPGGAVVDAIDFDGIIGGIAIGPDQRIFAVVGPSDGGDGALVIIDADGTQNTIDLGAPAVGVAVDSYGWAYVTGYASAVDTTATLTVITPDGTVAEPIILGDEPWIGIAVDGDDFLYGTDTADNTANLISIIPVGDWDYGYDDVDAGTGAVSGVVYVLDPGNRFTYTLTTAPDPTLGSVSVDASTGDWVFTPTAQARLDAAESPDDIWVPFTITGSYGQTSTVVDVEVWIEPVATEYHYETTVLDSLGLHPLGITMISDGHLLVTGVVDPLANHPSGTLSVMDTDGSIAGTVDIGGLPIGVVAGTDGRIYVSDLSSGTVSIIDPADPESPVPFATVPAAAALALDSAGRLYVTSYEQGTSAGTLTIFDADGTTADSIDLDGPSMGIVVTADGLIYVTHAETPTSGGGLTVFNPDLTVAYSLDFDGKFPRGVAVGPNGIVYIADIGNSEVIAIGLDGSTEAIAVEQPVGLTVGNDGRIYVTSVASDSITVITVVPGAL